MSDQQTKRPTDEEIALCAFLIYEREGCPPGLEKDHWHQAESQLCAMRAHEHANGHSPGADGARVSRD